MAPNYFASSTLVYQVNGAQSLDVEFLCACDWLVLALGLWDGHGFPCILSHCTAERMVQQTCSQHHAWQHMRHTCMLPVWLTHTI